MIDSGRVKSFISHEDPTTASLAISYFTDSWSDDTEILPLALEAFRKSNAVEIFCIYNLPITQESLEKTLKLLPAVREKYRAENLRDVVAGASPQILTANMPLIEKANNLSSETVRRIYKNIKLSHLSPDELWKGLRKYAADKRGAVYIEEVNLDYVRDALELLAPTAVPDNAFIVSELENIDPDEEGVLEMILIKLAGARKLKEAIPTLVDRLTEDDDYAPAWASDALVRIGSMGAVPLIKEAYIEDGGAFNLECVQVLECLRGDMVEDALLELLRHEKDECNRTFICSALCHHISEKGVEVVREEIKKGYDYMAVDLEAELLAVCNILGLTLPEEEELKAAVKTSKERRKAALKENFAKLDDRNSKA